MLQTVFTGWQMSGGTSGRAHHLSLCVLLHRHLHVHAHVHDAANCLQARFDVDTKRTKLAKLRGTAGIKVSILTASLSMCCICQQLSAVWV